MKKLVRILTYIRQGGCIAILAFYVAGSALADATDARVTPESGASLEHAFVTYVVGRERIDSHCSLVLESVARSSDVAQSIGFERMKSWVDLKIMKIRKTHQWDADGRLWLTIHYRDFERIGDAWSAYEVELVDHAQRTRWLFVYEQDDWVVWEKAFARKNGAREKRL